MPTSNDEFDLLHCKHVIIIIIVVEYLEIIMTVYITITVCCRTVVGGDSRYAYYVLYAGVYRFFMNKFTILCSLVLTVNTLKSEKKNTTHRQLVAMSPGSPDGSLGSDWSARSAWLPP